MKTSNKLLLGLFVLIILVITIGFVILKFEFNKLKLSITKGDGTKTEKLAQLEKLDKTSDKYLDYINYI